MLKKLTDVLPVIGSTILFGSVIVLYKKVTSVSKTTTKECNTLLPNKFGYYRNMWYFGYLWYIFSGTCGTSGTSGTWSLQFDWQCQTTSQCLPGASIVIRLPNNISRRHCNFFDKIKNPRISTRVRGIQD